jgi:DNA polymerase III delta subunit
VAAVISARFAPRGALAFLAGKKKIRNRGRDTSAGEVAAEEFEELDSGARAEFLKREAERLGFSLRPDAARLLAGAYAGNTWGAVTELQKAALLGKNPIEGDDLSRTGVSAMPAFWGFIERFRRGNAPSRLAVLEELFALKEPAAKFFNILAYQLPEKMNLVARCDEAVKSGKLDYEEALLALALAEK